MQGTETRESGQGTVVKCLLKSDEGFKPWDTAVAEKGSPVEFFARIQRSQQDPYFGFYNRSTKIQLENNGELLTKDGIREAELAARSLVFLPHC